MLALLATLALSQANATVKCVLAVPPGEKPTPDAQARLDTVLKDAQWWYSCQMEAYGYGAKTFGLELDDQGKVVVNVVQLPDALPPTTDSEARRAAVVKAAQGAVGKGSVMVLVYNGYYWTNEKRNEMLPMGWGLAGQWAHLTNWHLLGLNPKARTSETAIDAMPQQNPWFPANATRVYQTFKDDGSRTVGERASACFGAFFHEMGHSFGLHHPATGAPKFVGDLMASDGLWGSRGNFVETRNDWCCLNPDEAAILNKNPLFQVRKVQDPSSAAPRSVGMRGAIDANVKRSQFAAITVIGKGVYSAWLSPGERSQGNREYAWKDVPSAFEGMNFNLIEGGLKYKIDVQVQSAGRVYVATAEQNSAVLAQNGWRMIPWTISYAEADGRLVFPMFIYTKEVRANTVLDIPQREWTGTIVIWPNAE